jgi:hypothetical protein
MTAETADAQCELIRARTIDAAYRCLDRLARRLSRDWPHCGKAACLRARRCRGSACAPDLRGDDAIFDEDTSGDALNPQTPT